MRHRGAPRLLRILTVSLPLFAGATLCAQGISNAGVPARPTDRAQAASLGAPHVGAGNPGDDALTSPLERKIVLHLRNVSLRDALDRVAAAARFRLSYSAELLPLDRSVRASFDSTMVSAALAELLQGIAVTAVAAGPEQVVLTPVSRQSSAMARASAERQPVALDRVVVTGSASGQSERALTVALDVVNGRAAEQAGVRTLSDGLNASVPGIWVWGQSPTSLLARYASIRGASSFGASYPKVYIDGIEVANPLLVTQFDGESLERVEVIRGPQGAALYGADAISGVVNFITRQEGTDAGAPRARFRSATGLSQTSFAPTAVLAQDYALSLNGGSLARSGQLHLAAGSLGAYYQGATQQYFRANGGGRWIGEKTTVTATARLLFERVGAAVNPLVSDSALAIGGGTPLNPTLTAVPQSVGQYTLGATARYAADERWTHTFVAGLDGYSLTNVANETTPFPSSSDSALRASSGRADRATLRASSVARLDLSPTVNASWTFSAEHSALREQSEQATTVTAGNPRTDNRGPGNATSPVAPSVTLPAVQWLTSTGVVGQADLAWKNALFVTAGLRFERSDAFLSATRYSTLPMLGVATVFDWNGTTLKLRAAYGKGIRAPRTANRVTVQGGLRALASLSDLAPEEQTGVEAGFDLYLGDALTLQVTRFDQLASGLIQQVVIANPSSGSGSGGSGSGGSGSNGSGRIALQYQNVGAIANRGWEVAGTARNGALSLTTALSFVDSHVQRLAAGYSGDLRRNDRILGVPAATASATLAWTRPEWSASVGVSRATDWIEYDRVELAKAYANFDRRTVPLIGAELRGFWRDYDGNTHLRASFARSLGKRLSLIIGGENLLDMQRGEPDNVTILPGRTITTGLRASFY